MRDAVKNAGLEKGSFVDVGANTGLHSMFMSKVVAHVHGFDPYEPVVERFRRAVESIWRSW